MVNQLKTKQRREPLTRERVITTALRLMDEEGLESVTMRRIGRELGVEAMSLYNHVADKDDILAGICEHVLAGFRVADVEDWTEAARLGAREYRRLLREHPKVITLMTGQKGAFTNPESLRGYEFALDVFARAGLTGAEGVKAFHAFGGFILGFVMFELGLTLAGEDNQDAQGHEAMARLVGSADLPRLREALPHFLECDDEEQFEFGLDLLIEGLRARAALGRTAD
jgi:TetR/AcrR family transcriptional regulator, tetracycline repressor protein